MLEVILNDDAGIARLSPRGPLSVEDFQQAKEKIDPFIERQGSLTGLMIYVDSFPGWDSFVALAKHLKFVQEHHRKIKRIAFVTDSAIGEIAERIGSHFVAAEIKHFPFRDLEDAQHWLTSQ
jgi:hypothetical protein